MRLYYTKSTSKLIFSGGPQTPLLNPFQYMYPGYATAAHYRQSWGSAGSEWRTLPATYNVL